MAGAYVKGLALEDPGQGDERLKLDGCWGALGEITYQADADGLAVEALCDGGDGLSADLAFPLGGCIDLPNLIDREVASPGEVVSGRVGGVDNDVAPSCRSQRHVHLEDDVSRSQDRIGYGGVVGRGDRVSAHQP